MDKTNKAMNFQTLLDLFSETQSEFGGRALKSVNSNFVVRNWLFGRYIVEYEQNGADSAEYGQELLKTISQKLKERLGKGYSVDNLELMRRFYLNYSPEEISLPKSETVSRILESKITEENKCQDKAIARNNLAIQESFIAKLYSNFKLSWSHYVFLLGIKNKKERSFYEIETINSGWSLRELKRQFNTSLFERIALSKDKAGVIELAEKGVIVSQQQDLIKDPYILEFLGLDENTKYSESQLESAIIDKLEHFLLELGKGFLFEARQKRFSFNEQHFYVDLVFYNRLLRCYVLIDLKIGEIKHQDLGQMQMYVNYFDRYVKTEEEAQTVGIILCKKSNTSIVEITLPKDANIHASEYQLYLPSKEELRKQLEEAQRDWEAKNEA